MKTSSIKGAECRIARVFVLAAARMPVVLFLTVSLLGCASLQDSTAPGDSRNLEPLTPCDDYAFQNMFKGRSHSYPPAPWKLIPVHSSLASVDLKSAHGECLERWYHLYRSFRQLRREDDEFKQLFDQVEKQVISEVGERPSSMDVRLAAYRRLFELGMLHAIAAHADASRGSPGPAGPLPPELARIPRDADKDDAGVTAAFPSAEASEECSRIFYYCASVGRVRMSHFGEPALERCLANLQRRREEDPEFRERLLTTVRSLNERAAQVDPADSAQALEFQLEIFAAMERAGISREISESP